MKRTRLLLFSFCCSSFFGVSAQNLLSNPGFESWEDVSLPATGWIRGAGGFGDTPSEGADVVFSRTSQARSGNYALLMDSRITGTDAAKRCGSPLLNDGEPLSPGTYHISMWVKGKGALRFVALTLDGQNPTSTGAPRPDNHFVLCDGNTPADRPEWTQITTSIAVPESFTPGNYRLHLSVQGTGAFDASDCFLIDDIVVEKAQPVLQLSSLAIRPNGAYEKQLLVKDFRPDQYTYHIQTSLPQVPLVFAECADASVMPVITQAQDINGTPAQRTAVITLKNGEAETAYEVIFEKHPGFVSGFFFKTGASAASMYEWNDVQGVYTQNATNKGVFYGEVAARMNTGVEEAWLETPVLENGISAVSFYARGDNSLPVFVEIQKKAGDEAWVSVEKHAITSANWTRYESRLQEPRRDTQIRYLLTKTGTTGYGLYFDDAEILPYDPTTGTGSLEKSDMYCYGAEGRLFLSGARGHFVTVVDAFSGKTCAAGIAVDETVCYDLTPGVYLVRCGGRVLKCLITGR